MVHLVTFAEHFTGVDAALYGRLLSLLILPFAHEDLAIVFGAYFIDNDLAPVGTVVMALYGGIVASDIGLYAIGVGARHVPWLNRFAIDARVPRLSEALKRNLVGIFALSRVVPGFVFVAFVACGWSRVPLRRFTLTSLGVSAIYLPPILYLAIKFGDVIDQFAGIWTWPLLLGALASLAFLRQKFFSFDIPEAGATAANPTGAIIDGMPFLPARDRTVAAAERIPPALFYAPLVLNWLRLGLRHCSLTLPSAANPTIVTGGMWGESKASYFAEVGQDERQWIANYILCVRQGPALQCEVDAALERLTQAGLSFPLVAKPDVGWHGRGVRLLAHETDLRNYFAACPPRAAIMLQRFIPYAAEAAVLYARHPGEPRGTIRSLTLRYFPHVIGDGASPVRALIAEDERARWKAALHLGGDATHNGLTPAELDRIPDHGEIVQIALIGNQRAGGHYRDGQRYITPLLEERFDAIARSMRDFHYGRFDIRFLCTESLMRGEALQICEINGIGGEAIDAWDPHLNVREVYRRLFAEQQVLFALGAANRARGFRPTPPGAFLAALAAQSAAIKRYPASS